MMNNGDFSYPRPSLGSASRGRKPRRSPRPRSSKRWTPSLERFEERTLLAAAIGVNIPGNMGGLAGGPVLIPPDTDGAVGPNDFAEFTNGAFTVFSKTGATRLAESDATFWNNAGIPTTVTNVGLSDPRILFDPLSNTWFAVEINVANTGNQLLVGRSDTTDPAGTWKATSFTADPGFADYPTLGIDANAIYVGFNDFTSSTGGLAATSAFSIPKADLLASSPSAANRSTTRSTSAALGWTIFGATNFSTTTPAHGVLTAVDFFSFGRIQKTNVTGTGGADASFGSPTAINVANTSFPGNARQPNGTRVIDGNDDRIATTVHQIGDLIFLVHGISVNAAGVAAGVSSTSTNAVRITVLRDSTNAVVTEATYYNTNYDYIYPSLSVNDNGNMLIGFTRSSSSQGSGATNGNLGSYAVEAKIDMSNPGAGISFIGSDIQLKAGNVNNYSLNAGGQYRWGDYSATSLDPTDPGTFWTVQEYAEGSVEWGTQVSQIGISPTLKSLTSTTAAGTYGQGQVINVTANFDLPVKVTGSPTIALSDGAVATYIGGSGTTQLTFSYTTAYGETTGGANLNAASSSALSGGTISNLSVAAATAVLTVPTSGSNALSSAGIKIDAVAPVVQSYNVRFGSQSYDLIGSSRTRLPWEITGITAVFSKPISQADLASFGGIAATSISGLGTNSITWNFNAISLGSFATTLAGSGGHAIADSLGNALTAGAGFAQNFKVLWGDVNDDGVVNASDMVLTNIARTQAYNAIYDVNGDGIVDISDVIQVRRRNGTTQP